MEPPDMGSIDTAAAQRQMRQTLTKKKGLHKGHKGDTKNTK